MLAVTISENSADSLDPLWEKAKEAAQRGDIPGALFIWKSLADKGVWQIYARIGDLYERGADGVGKDIDQALRWYRKAVFEGDDPIAHVGLGRAYYNGIGVDRNIVMARKHFESAYSYGLPEAAIYLGIMYYLAAGVNKDTRRAEKYFEVAATDYPYACFFLARIAFLRGRLLKGLKLWIKGVILGTEIAKKDPADPRLLGFDALTKS